MDLHFQQQFKQPLLDCTKIQTFRKSIRCSIGAIANLVLNPYSPNREIVRSVVINSIIPIKIDAETKTVSLGNRDLNREGIRIFAHNDGFENEEDMWRYIIRYKYSGNSYLYMWSYFNYSQFFKPIVISYNDINQTNK